MTVLITGANRGIGRGLFDHYHQQGETVFGTARDGQKPFLKLDVRDPSSHLALAKELKSTPIDLLICNAGQYVDKGQSLATGYPPDLWTETFATNVSGVFQTIQNLLPNLRAAAAPSIAIISSLMASQQRANGGSYIYRASKAAVLNLGRNLATDLKGDGIAVGIYHPGWVVTDMGGENADIDVAASVAGLSARFSDLSMASTGCFLGWDGNPLPY